jgi:hypothetical protein
MDFRTFHVSIACHLTPLSLVEEKRFLLQEEVMLRIALNL